MFRYHAWLSRIAVVWLGTTSPLAAQGYESILSSGRRTMSAERLREGEAIVLDGRLDEPAWARAVPAADFIQQAPVLGGKPTESTEVRIVFNRDHLYMGVTCYDSDPTALLGNTMKRDETLGSDDRFMWTMDTFLDQRSGYFFEMNPSGLMADALIGAGGGSNRQWDGIWNARVRRNQIGWTLEITIPFRTLNFDPRAPAWGINFQRTIRRKNEENLWTGHLFNQGLRRMSNAGLLVGISDVSQGIGLDLRPYATASAGEAPGRGEPAFAGTAKAGLDLLYNLTPSLRANFTVNTDFAETEVDQRRVNLTRFPLFFPEKREFFLDGATFFDFYQAGSLSDNGGPVHPIFSRRIGLGSEGTLQKIDFGTKLTGQAGAYDLGLLHVRTANQADFTGEDFLVARVKRRVLTQSSFGGIYTLRHARTRGTPSLQTAGLDFRLATSEFRGSSNLELEGFAMWNTNPTGTGDNLAYGVQVSYPNDRWNARISFDEVQRNHAPALGFTPRTGYRSYEQSLRFSPRPERHRFVRRLSFGGEMALLTDPDSRLLTREIDLTAFRVELHSLDNFEVQINPTVERLERDFEIVDGVVLPSGAEYDFIRYALSLNTASRRILSVRPRFEWGGFFAGRRREISFDLALRPRPGITINLETEWNRVELPQGEFDTRVFRLVADTQFNPWVYMVNTVQHDSVSHVAGWQSRFRWIVTPGNDLYFVYTHNWRDDPIRNRFSTLDRRAATKVVYTHRF